ncbi:MAG: L28 family ribosomal protein [bacterium]|nr:L28 family ribosomal protein [bacterium]
MKVCQRCEKKTQSSFSRSHSNIASKRRQYPNLQKCKIAGIRMLLCASCIKIATKEMTK